MQIDRTSNLCVVEKCPLLILHKTRNDEEIVSLMIQKKASTLSHPSFALNDFCHVFSFKCC